MWLNKQDHCQEVLGLKFGSFINSYNNCLVAQVVISLPETTKSCFFFFKADASALLLWPLFFISIYIYRVGIQKKVQIGFHSAAIGCETTSSRPDWRWRCYGNCWCCSHLWGASQVKHLIKNFWCMPKLPLSSVRPYSYVFGAGDGAKAAVENGATSARLAACLRQIPPPHRCNGEYNGSVSK